MGIRISLVELVVADMARSLAFYRLLGLAVPAEADEEPHVDFEIGAGMRIAWDTIDTIKSFDASWTSPSGGHRTALAFACDSAAEVDETFARLVAAGHHGHLQPFDAFWGHRYAVLHDPDGIPVDLFAPLPAA